MLRMTGAVVLETERLILRPFTVNDATDMFFNWGSDPLAARYMFWEPYHSVEEVRLTIEEWLKNGNDVCQWAIFLKAEQTVIGAINLHGFDELHESAEFGYVLGRRYWSKGYMTEALREVIRYGFEAVNLNRIYADHFVSNPASGKVMQKAGLRFEGTSRQKYRGKNGFEDTNNYAILKSDYFGT